MASKREFEMLFALNARMNGGFSGSFSKAQAEFTRLWKEEKTKSKVKVTSPSAYGMSSAESLLRSHDTTPEWDEGTGQYYAQYKEGGDTYKIWLEEETSLKKKLEVVNKQGAAGVAFWKLGFERAATWSAIEGEIK